jgi:A/G-specific adenine glycosylase
VKRSDRVRESRLGHLRRYAILAGRRNAIDFPWRRRPTPFAVLVAEVLLQHTPSARVAPVFTRLIRRWPTFRALSRARARSLERLLRPLGLQRRRARALVAMARSVTCLWTGRLPADPVALRRLPGVGAYTAGVTVTVAANRPAGFVDGGLARFLSRYLGVAKGQTREARFEALICELVGRGNARFVAWGLLDLSRTVCRRRPRCEACPVSMRCVYAARAAHMI